MITIDYNSLAIGIIIGIVVVFVIHFIIKRTGKKVEIHGVLNSLEKVNESLGNSQKY